MFVLRKLSNPIIGTAIVSFIELSRRFYNVHFSAPDPKHYYPCILFRSDWVPILKKSPKAIECVKSEELHSVLSELERSYTFSFLDYFRQTNPCREEDREIHYRNNLKEMLKSETISMLYREEISKHLP